MFIFSSPCNPTGSVYSKEELAGLAEVFKRYPDVFIISDEIYEYINFVGKHESIAQFPELTRQGCYSKWHVERFCHDGLEAWLYGSAQNTDTGL